MLLLPTQHNQHICSNYSKKQERRKGKGRWKRRRKEVSTQTGERGRQARTFKVNRQFSKASAQALPSVHSFSILLMLKEWRRKNRGECGRSNSSSSLSNRFSLSFAVSEKGREGKHKGEHTLATKKKKKKQKNRGNWLDSVCAELCPRKAGAYTASAAAAQEDFHCMPAKKKEKENGSLFGCLRGAITASLFAPMQQQRTSAVHQRKNGRPFSTGLTAQHSASLSHTAPHSSPPLSCWGSLLFVIVIICSN